MFIMDISVTPVRQQPQYASLLSIFRYNKPTQSELMLAIDFKLPLQLFSLNIPIGLIKTVYYQQALTELLVKLST